MCQSRRKKLWCVFEQNCTREFLYRVPRQPSANIFIDRLAPTGEWFYRKIKCILAIAKYDAESGK